jgi:hypothetical protein
LAVVDLAAAKVTGDVTVSAAPAGVALSADRLVWYASGGTTAHVLDRADLSAAETTVTLPGTTGTPYLGIAGRWLVVARSVPASSDYWATCPATTHGRPPRGRRRGHPAPAREHLGHPDTGRRSAGRGRRRLRALGGAQGRRHGGGRADADGGDRRTAGGRDDRPAVAAERQPGHRRGRQQPLPRLLTPGGSRRWARPTRRARSHLAHLERLRKDGPVLRRRRAHGGGSTPTPPPTPGSSVQSLDDTDSAGFFFPSAAGTVLDITGRYAIVNGSSPAKQYVGDLGVYSDLKPIVTRSVTAASVWGAKLWTPGTANGVVTAKDLKTGKVTDTVSTGAPCVAKELQVVGRWVYWSCGPTGKAGVWDRTAKKNITVPSGEALLGDGYLVRHDTAAGPSSSPPSPAAPRATRTIGALAAGAGNSSLRGVSWTVDKFGGPAAYVDADRRIHLVPSGVAPAAARLTESGATDNTSGPGRSATRGGSTARCSPGPPPPGRRR